MPYYSRAYGLSLVSDSPIPGLTVVHQEHEPDVDIRLLPGSSWLERSPVTFTTLFYASSYLVDNQPGWTIRYAPSYAWYKLRYYDGTEFLVDSAGKRIYGTWTESITLEDCATYLLGPLMGFILGLHGIVGLHASSVVFDGSALAFVGSSGTGKSTTAAILVQAGCKALTDDIAALEDRGTAFLVYPGYPRLRLWNDSTLALFGSTDALPLISPNWDKRYLDLRDSFSEQPVPLSAIYILDNTGEVPVNIVCESQTKALLTLVTNSMVDYPFEKQKRAREFDTMSRIIKHVPIKSLIYNPRTVSADALIWALKADQAQNQTA